jgi:flagellar FliJ protein
MKAFQFPLQTVLDVRKHREDEAQQRFVALQKQLNEARRRLRQLQTLLQDAEQTACTDDVHVHSLINFDGYQRRMTERIRRQETLCENLQTEVNAARRQLMEACRERQTLELLRKNQHDEHRRTAAKLESQALDEAGTLGYNRDDDDVFTLSYRVSDPLEAG